MLPSQALIIHLAGVVVGDVEGRVSVGGGPHVVEPAARRAEVEAPGTAEQVHDRARRRRVEHVLAGPEGLLGEVLVHEVRHLLHHVHEVS